MSEDLVSEHAWQWKIDLPVERFHPPIEMFWRGLNYVTRWAGEELRGEREMDGQRREFLVQIRSVGSGVVEVRCRLAYLGAPTTRRPQETYQPSDLVELFGKALARGFGPPTLAT